jgi:outer membrane protein TolC
MKKNTIGKAIKYTCRSFSRPTPVSGESPTYGPVADNGFMGHVGLLHILSFILSWGFIYSGSLSYAQSLDDYFKIAASDNPGLQAMHKEYEAAMQVVPQVNTLPDPEFSFGYFMDPDAAGSGAKKTRFALSQMFPWFGTLKAQGNAAAIMAEARFQAFIDARNTLYFQVASAYYPLFEIKRLQQIETENIEILKSYKTIATKKFENGASSMVDVLRVDIRQKDAITNLGILNAKEKPYLTTFNKLLNRDVNEPVTVSDALVMEPMPADMNRDSLISENPGLKELDLKLKAGRASEQAAYKNGLPTFGVGLAYEYALEDDGMDEIMAEVSVSIPIFRAKYTGAVKEAQLMQKSYSLQKEALANTLTSDHAMAWFELEQQRQMLALYEQQIRTTQHALDLLFSAYSNSGKGFEELLGMRQELLSYDRMKIAAEVQYQISLAKLKVLTGRTDAHEKQ